MKVKRKLVLILCCVLTCCMLLAIGIFRILSKNNKDSNTLELTQSIYKSDIAKMVSLLFYSKNELQNLPREIFHEDTNQIEWYDDYINGLASLGLLEANEETMESKWQPIEYAKEIEVKQLIQRMCVLKGIKEEKEATKYYENIQEKLSFELDEMNSEQYIDKNDWDEIYHVLVQEFAVEKEAFQEKEVYVLGSKTEDESLEEWEIVCDESNYTYEGYDVKAMLDKKLRIYVKNSEILYISEILKEETVLSNVWIEENKDQEIMLYVSGIERTLYSEFPLSEDVRSVIGDITVKNGIVTKIVTKPEIVKGKVLCTNKEYIEIEIDGIQQRFSLDKKFKIYRVYGEMAMELTSGILVGYDNTEFVLANNKICAGLITSSIHAKDIRVLLKTEGFKELFHQSITVTSDSPFVIEWSGEEKKYKALEEVTIEVSDPRLKESRISIRANTKNGKIKVLSFKRNQEYPSYRGTIEIANMEDKMVIINELTLEEYLYAVLPSEMPSSYGVEALKVQAVCARSYAYTHLLSNAYAHYGAHVDDSISFQVYNNTSETDTTIKAVDETYGQVLEYNNDIITAYYFSTSSGHTSSAKEVWLLGKSYPYLEGSFQNESGVMKEKLDLTQEADFRRFIVENAEETYDSKFSWYRWKVTMSTEHIKKSIDKNLYTRYEANPSLILTKQEDGNFISIPIDTVGKVENIIVNKRTTGGLVTDLIVVGSKNTIQILSEYNIRTILAPLFDVIIRQDGSEVANQGMLPSSFFFIEQVEGENFSFQGGGYGHGVGMSQNGAKAMADSKKTYDQILQHYYKGTNLGFIY